MPTLKQYEFNVGRSPDHVGADALPRDGVGERPVRYIAYYLPQFHAIRENDEAWGRGFTEWTNATKALPRYTGHYQPRLPADLGFYNLTDKTAIKAQMDLAKRGGIAGFCIHHYWFSGRQVLDTPLRIILDNPDLDLPFCLNWANESWSRRWDGSEREIIIPQRHDVDDDIRFAASILEALRDPRYIRIDGRPVIMIYRPNLMPDPKRVMAAWRAFLTAAGVGDPYLLMPQSIGVEDPRDYGLDAAAGFPPHVAVQALDDHRRRLDVFDYRWAGQAFSYDDLAAQAQTIRPADFRYFPGVCPSWDNEARKPHGSFGFYGATPAKYGRWLEAASRQAMTNPTPDERIVFINAWNEWAEGAYLEPDRHYGYAYLAETRRVLDGLQTGSTAPRASAPLPLAARPAFHRVPRNYAFDVTRVIARALKARKP